MKRSTTTALVLIATSVLFTNPVLAKGIDWEGVLVDPPNKQSFQKSRASGTNLPGVGSAKPRRSDKVGCQNNRIFSDAERAQCNRKTPLLIFRNGTLESAFTGTPR